MMPPEEIFSFTSLDPADVVSMGHDDHENGGDDIVAGSGSNHDNDDMNERDHRMMLDNMNVGGNNAISENTNNINTNIVDSSTSKLAAMMRADEIRRQNNEFVFDQIQAERRQDPNPYKPYNSCLGLGRAEPMDYGLSCETRKKARKQQHHQRNRTIIVDNAEDDNDDDDDARSIKTITAWSTAHFEHLLVASKEREDKMFGLLEKKSRELLMMGVLYIALFGLVFALVFAPEKSGKCMFM